MLVTNTEHARWYYDASCRSHAGEPTHPSTPPQWTAYRDIEMYLIEEAFQAGSESVRLDPYHIDLKNFLQLRLDDDSKDRKSVV